MNDDGFKPLDALNAVRDARAAWLSSPERVVLLTLILHAERDAIAWCPQSRLTEETGLSERRIWSALKTLVREGAIELIEAARQHHAARYSLAGTAERLRLATRAALGASPAPGAGLRDEPGAPLDSRPAPHAGLVSQTRTTCGSEPPRDERGAAEGSQKRREERESPRPSEVRVRADEPGTRTPIPDDLPLTGDAKAFAETIGVRDIPDEWTKFVAHHVKIGDLADTRGWYRGAWKKWCVDAKRFQSERRMRDAQRQQRADADVVRPYHEVAKLAPKPPSKVTAGELAGARELANLFKPKAVGS